MKYFVAVFVFFITLGLTIQSIAKEPMSLCNAKTAASAKECAPEKHDEHDDHSALANRMNSLFPEKQQQTELSKRPSAVELITPKFMSRVTSPAKLEWKESTGADAYHLQIATDPNFKWLVVNEHFVKATSFEFSKAEAGQKYFWRVAAESTKNDAMFMKSNFVSSIFIVK